MSIKLIKDYYLFGELDISYPEYHGEIPANTMPIIGNMGLKTGIDPLHDKTCLIIGLIRHDQYLFNLLYELVKQDIAKEADDQLLIDTFTMNGIPKIRLYCHKGSKIHNSIREELYELIKS